MKNSKKNFGNAGQSITEVKTSQKHDANLQKNSGLYFQIGLILCLLATYSLFEMQFQEKKITLAQVDPIDDDIFIDRAPIYQVEVIEPEKVVEPKRKEQKVIDKIKPIEDDKDILEARLVTPNEEKPVKKAAAVSDIPDIPVDKSGDEDLVPFIRIEKVPVYPGCEKFNTNDERKKCMSEKITKLVSRKFNGDIASENGLSGVQRIYAQFTIDKAGNVVNVKARAPHPALEKEAQRVINKIPNMQPGLQRNTPVGVIYTLPISFQVRD